MAMVAVDRMLGADGAETLVARVRRVLDKACGDGAAAASPSPAERAGRLSGAQRIELGRLKARLDELKDLFPELQGVRASEYVERALGA